MEGRSMKSGACQQALKCAVCDRIYKSSRALARHKYKHKMLAVFTCSDCGKTFPTNTRLNIHSRVHSGKRPFKCSYCSVYFASTFQLKLHHRRHTGEKPYICSYCQKSFSSSSGLQQHVKTHTNESPFSCSQCSRSFKQREKLKQHERIHTGIRPYMCDRCPSTFRVKNSLVRHLRIHSGETFKCKLCPKEFGELYSLKKHHRRQHDKLQFTNPGKKSVSEDHSVLFATDFSVAKHIRANPTKIKTNVLKNKKQQQVKRSLRKNKHTSDVELNKVVAENLHLAIGCGDIAAVVDEYGWHRIPLSVGGDLLNKNMKPAGRELLNRNTETLNGNKKITAVLNTRKQHDDLILLRGQRSCVEEEQQFEQKGCIAADNMCQHQTVTVSKLDREGQLTCNTGGRRRREASRPSTIEYFPITDQSPRCEYMYNRECSQFLMSPMSTYSSDCYVREPGCVPPDGKGPEQRSHTNNFGDCPVVSPRFYSRLCHQNIQQTEVDKLQISNPGSFYQSQRLGQLGGQHHHHTATLHHHPDAHENSDLLAYPSTHQPCNRPQGAQTQCPASSWPTQRFRSLEATAYGKNPSHIQHHLPGNYQQTLDLTQLQTTSGLSSVVSSTVSLPQSFVEKTYQYSLCQQECVGYKQQVPAHQDCVQSNLQSISQVESVNSQLHLSNVQCSIKSIHPLLHNDELVPSNQQQLQQHTSALPDQHQAPESNQQELFTCNSCLKTESLALPDTSTCQAASNVESLSNSVETFSNLKSSVVHHKRFSLFHHKPSCVVPPDWSGEACPDNCWQIYPHMQQPSSNFLHNHLSATVSDSVHNISRNMFAFSGQPDCLARDQLVRTVIDNLGLPQTTSDANIIIKSHSRNRYLSHELVQRSVSCIGDHSLLAHLPRPRHTIPLDSQHKQAAVLHLKDCSHSQKVCSDRQEASSNTQEVCSGVEEDCSDIHKSTKESRNERTRIHLQDELCHFPERVDGILKQSSIFPHSLELHNLGEPKTSHVCELASAVTDLGNGSVGETSVGVSGNTHLCGEHNVDVPGRTHLCGEHNVDVPDRTHLCGEHNVDVPGRTHLCGEHNVDVPGRTHLCGEHNVDVPDRTHLCGEHNVDVPGRTHLCGEHNVDVPGRTHLCGEHNVDVPDRTHLCGEHNVDVPGRTHLCGEHNVDVPDRTHLCGEHNVDVPGRTHLCGEHNVDVPGRTDLCGDHNVDVPGRTHLCGEHNVDVPDRTHLCGEHNVDVPGRTHLCGEHNVDVPGRTDLCGDHNVDVPGRTHLCGEHNVDVPGRTDLCGEHNVDVPGSTHLCGEHNVDISCCVKSRSLNYARLREGGVNSQAALEVRRREGFKQISDNRSLNCSQHTTSSCPLSPTHGEVSCSHPLGDQLCQVERASSTGESEHTEGTNKDIVCIDTLKGKLPSVRRRKKNSTNKLEGKKSRKYVVNFDESNFVSCQPLGVISVTVAAGSQTTTEKENNLGSIQEHVPINSDKNGAPQCRKEDREVREKHKLRRQVDKVIHKCDTCGKQFPHRSHLQRHIKIHASEKPYPCHLCSQGFTTQKYLHNHIRRHNKQPATFYCEGCGKIFGRKYQLKIHTRTHSGEKPYKCPQCSSHFATSFQVQLHGRVHSEVRPYKCQHCSKCFRSHANLALHVKRHNNDRSYLCATCGATFYEASKLTAHIRVHTGVHPFMCDQCPKTFKVKHLLVRHLRWHSGDTFNCEHCNKQFDEKWTLRAHIARRHSATSLTL